jgi:hypothetical protein
VAKPAEVENAHARLRAQESSAAVMDVAGPAEHASPDLAAANRDSVSRHALPLQKYAMTKTMTAMEPLMKAHASAWNNGLVPHGKHATARVINTGSALTATIVEQ